MTSQQNSTDALDKPSAGRHHHKHSTKRCDEPLNPQPYWRGVAGTDNGDDVSLDPSILSVALVVWTGMGVTASPSREEARVIERFGEAVALDLLPRLRQLQDDFYLSTAYNTASDLKAMGDAAAEEFRRMHPEIGDEVDALAWCYTFDWK